MTYRTLTPAYREEIQNGISAQLNELSACESNVLVLAQRNGLLALSELIKALPDGYPIPLREGKE